MDLRPRQKLHHPEAQSRERSALHSKFQQGMSSVPEVSHLAKEDSEVLRRWKSARGEGELERHFKGSRTKEISRS